MRILRSSSGIRVMVLLLCSITLLGLAVGSQSRQSNQAIQSGASSHTQSVSTSTAPFDYIVTVLMENNGYCDVMTTCGGSGTYMSSLAQSYSVVGQNGYTAVDHPSEPNYIALAGASTLGISGDGNCCGQLSAPNILDRVEASGRTWQAWAEDAGNSGTCSFSPPRSADHFPFLEFSDITSNSTRCAHFQSTTSSSDTEFLSSLNATSPANYIWLTPNDNDNCHDTSIPTCDSYVAGLVPEILGSNMFKTQKAALFIVYDEGSGTYPSDWVYATWAGPVVKTGYVGTGSYSHYSYAKTLETVWGMPSLTTNDVAASAMTEFFGTSAPLPLSTTFTVSGTPAIAQPMTFTSSTTGGKTPYNFTWNFGDGSLGSGSTVTHAFTRAQTFTVTETVADSSSPTQTATSNKQVTISAPLPLSTSFTISSNPLITLPVTFTSSTTGGTTPFTVTWNFGDGNAGSGVTTTHIFSTAHTFTVNETVTDSSTPTQTATSTQQVTVSTPAQLSASFTVNPTSPRNGTLVTFTATTAGGIQPYNYAWNFADGQTGNGQATTHTYATAGSYTVVLNVTDSRNHNVTASNTVTVSTTSPPDFTITTAPPALTIQQGQYAISRVTVSSVNSFTGTVSLTASADTGLNISLAGSSTTISPGAPQSLAVTIGVLPSANAGSYKATITGSTATLLHSTSLTVKAALKHQPKLAVPGPISTSPESTVKFTVNATDPDPNLVLVLTVNNLPQGATFDPLTGLFTWAPSLSQTGTYTVTFTATDDGSPPLASSQTVTMTVNQPLLSHQPRVTVPGPMSTNPGSSVQFTVNATDPDPSLTLVLAANNLPQGASFDPSTGHFTWTPSPYQSGNYTVTFTATDNGSPPMTTSQIFTIAVDQSATPPPQQPATATCSPLCQLANIGTSSWVLIGVLGGITAVIALVFVNTRTRLAATRWMKRQKQD